MQRVDAKIYNDTAALHALGAVTVFEVRGPDPDTGAADTLIGYDLLPDVDLSGYAAKAAALAVANLVAYAAAKRYAVETGGIVVAGVKVATDRDSQAMIGNAFAYVTASGADTVRFKAASGWVMLSADQVKALALAVGAHVQAAFATEDDLDAAINASPPTVTSTAQIDAAAWPSNA